MRLASAPSTSKNGPAVDREAIAAMAGEAVVLLREQVRNRFCIEHQLVVRRAALHAGAHAQAVERVHAARLGVEGDFGPD
jgi:hypothetical protein